MKIIKMEPRMLQLLRETERPSILVNYRLVDSVCAGLGFNNAPLFVDVYVEEMKLSELEVEEVQVITIEPDFTSTSLCNV